MNPKNFLAELKRRNVYKVAVAYAVIAWLLLQAGSILFPTFEAPSWVMKAFVTVIAAGFLIALVIAWAFEMTPAGMKRTENLSPNEHIPQWSGRKFATLIGTVSLVAGALLAFQLWHSRSSPNTTSLPQKSIAVLPFESLSEDKANAYFASGIQDEILTRLAKIADLKVISRTSTQQYQSKPGKLSTIAQELGVAHILEGSVQKSGDNVRVNVQLIKADGDRHLWADTYDRKLTDIFAVETEVAQRIAISLEAQLTGGERRQVAAVPTTNPKAYDAYLRGTELIKRQPIEDVKKGRDFLRQAVELDPSYARAWAQIAIAEAQIYFGTEHTPACLERARGAAETAVRLQPELSEARAALGAFYYACLQDFDRALLELQEALKDSPNDANTLFYIGLVKRRQGKLDESIEFLKKATVSDPRNQDIWANLGRSYRGKRDFTAAREMFDRAFAISPDEGQFIGDKAETYVAEGDLNSAEKLVRSPMAQGKEGTLSENVTFLTYRRRFEEAVAVVSKAMEGGKERSALDVAEDKSWLGSLQLRAGKQTAGRALLEEARRELLALRVAGEASLRLDDALLLTHAELGDRAEVEQLAGTLLARTKDDLWRAPESEMGVAMVFAILGDADRAFPSLERCLSAFYRRSLTPALLRLDPIWDPIRNDPRFQKLAEAKP